MNDRSPSAYLFSAALHGGAVALIVLLAYFANEPVQESPKIFELVAGAGDNFAATEAPAIGVPGGTKTAATLPAAPPVPQPAPIQPAPPEAAPAPPEPAPAAQTPPAPAKPAPAKPDSVPNFKKEVQRTASRKASRLEAAYKKKLEAEQKRMSYEEFQKQHGSKAAPQSKVSKLDPEGIRAGVLGGSTANKTGGAGGKALAREQQDLLESYFAMLRARLKEAHVPPPSVSESLSDPIVEFFVAADGSISRVHVVRSSGSAEFDQSVVDAFAQVRMPPRPDKKSDMNRTTFHVKDDEP